MVDVARLAGVAPMTVSRVANGLTNVEEGTRQRVLAAMDELGYRPNTAARALATGRFGMIGVVTFTLATYGNSRTVGAIATAAEERGYSVCLLPVHSASQGDVAGAVDRLRKQAVDGVIVIVEARLLDSPALSLPPGVPIVVADSGGASAYCVVDSDQSGGARQATEHLLELGHRNVWHIAGPSGRSRPRAGGPRGGARCAARASRRRRCWSATGRRSRATSSVARLADDPAVTAIFAANDQMALGAMRALHEAGRRVPDDVSVVGFDDAEDSASYWPPLTTIHQRFDEIGRQCVESLLHEIHHDQGELRKHIVETSLVVRASTAPAPQRRTGRS